MAMAMMSGSKSARNSPVPWKWVSSCRSAVTPASRMEESYSEPPSALRALNAISTTASTWLRFSRTKDRLDSMFSPSMPRAGRLGFEPRAQVSPALRGQFGDQLPDQLVLAGKW